MPAAASRPEQPLPALRSSTVTRSHGHQRREARPPAFDLHGLWLEAGTVITLRGCGALAPLPARRRGRRMVNKRKPLRKHARAALAAWQASALAAWRQPFETGPAHGVCRHRRLDAFACPQDPRESHAADPKRAALNDLRGSVGAVLDLQSVRGRRSPDRARDPARLSQLPLHRPAAHHRADRHGCDRLASPGRHRPGGSLPLSLAEAEQSLLHSIDFSDTLLNGMLSFLLFAGALHVNLGQAARAQVDRGPARHDRRG